MGLFSNDGPKLSGKAGDKLVDARGKRTTATDPRTSIGAKAEQPAYGFDGLTVEQIGELSAEQKRVKLALAHFLARK